MGTTRKIRSVLMKSAQQSKADARMPPANAGITNCDSHVTATSDAVVFRPDVQKPARMGRFAYPNADGGGPTKF
jgi:hypothetical protein